MLVVINFLEQKDGRKQLVVITSIIFFSGRLTALEFDYLINSLKTGNIFGIIVLILQILLVVVTVISYYEVIKLTKSEKK